MGIFYKIKKIFLDLLFPVFCFGCRKEGVFLCTGCKDKLIWIQPTCFGCRKWVLASGKIESGRTCLYCRKKSLIYAFFSPFLYSDPVVKDLIHGFKYNHLKSLANLLGEFLIEYLARFRISFPKKAIMIPIPLFRDRLRTRGFNQSELIVRYLSDRLGMKLETKILQKIRKTKPQVELSAEERRLNLKNAFCVLSSDAVRGKTIILVDDVKTTGSTLEEAARSLQMAGAHKIMVITVAH